MLRTNSLLLDLRWLWVFAVGLLTNWCTKMDLLSCILMIVVCGRADYKLKQYTHSIKTLKTNLDVIKRILYIACIIAIFLDKKNL